MKLGSLLVLLCAITTSAIAQVASAELSGTILDATGAVVANANVIATEVATGRLHETVSNTTGNYVLSVLPPGDYTISVTAPGFRKLVQTGLTLQVNQQAHLELHAAIGPDL